MNAKFRKGPDGPQATPSRNSKRLSKQPAKKAARKAPVSRVGDGKDHHDTHTPNVLYVLVDKPLEPADFLTLSQAAKPWPKASTKNAAPLTGHDLEWNGTAILVYYLAFENVADAGKLSLTLQRGESLVGLFTDVEFQDLFFRFQTPVVDPAFGPQRPAPPVGSKDPFFDGLSSAFGPQQPEGQGIHGNRRELDYSVMIPSRPVSQDPDLGWPDAPYTPLTETGP